MITRSNWLPKMTIKLKISRLLAVCYFFYCQAISSLNHTFDRIPAEKKDTHTPFIAAYTWVNQIKSTSLPFVTFEANKLASVVCCFFLRCCYCCCCCERKNKTKTNNFASVLQVETFNQRNNTGWLPKKSWESIQSSWLQFNDYNDGMKTKQ